MMMVHVAAIGVAARRRMTAATLIAYAARLRPIR